MNQTNLNFKEMTRISKGIYLVDNKYSFDEVIEKIENISSFKINQFYGMIDQKTGSYINEENSHLLHQADINKILGPYGIAEDVNQVQEKFSKLLNKNNALILIQKRSKNALQYDDNYSIFQKGEYIGNEPVNDKNKEDCIIYHVYEISLKNSLKNKKFNL